MIHILQNNAMATYVEMLYLFPCTMRRHEACSGFAGLISVVSRSEDGGRWNTGSGAFTTSGSYVHKNVSMISQFSDHFPFPYTTKIRKDYL